jgi:hypothetical protein
VIVHGFERCDLAEGRPDLFGALRSGQQMQRLAAMWISEGGLYSVPAPDPVI